MPARNKKSGSGSESVSKQQPFDPDTDSDPDPDDQLNTYTVAKRARFTSVLAICTLNFIASPIGLASATAAAPAASATASVIFLPAIAASALVAR